MITEQLQRLVASGSVRAPNYFNGRLLAAGDLQQEREAGRELLGRVAQAVGAGVAFGLEVSAVPKTTGSVLVRAGLAIGPHGDALRLDDAIALNVIAAAPPPPAAASGIAGFRRCQPPPAGKTEITNPGLHLLAVGPARASSGSVATSSLGSAVAACSLKDDVNGVRFVLLPFRRELEQALRGPTAVTTDAPARSRFRSRAALACFGPGPAFPAAPGIAEEPFPAFGALATATDPVLPACHVPLALLNIAGGGVDFVDMWAARRGLAAPSAAGSYGPWFSGRARSEAEAMTLAFQDQIEALIARFPDPESIAAEEWFAWLPPAGAVPVGGVSNSTGPDSVGVNFLTFFRSLATRKPAFIPVGLVSTFWDEGLRCPPTPLGGKSKPLVWLYSVRENLQPYVFNQPNPPRAVMLFASGMARFLGDARYDLGQWDFGNFA